jgi:hypothetical protein
MIVASMISWKRLITSSFTQQPTLTFKSEPVMESLTSVNGVDKETAQTLIEAGYDESGCTHGRDHR